MALGVLQRALLELKLLLLLVLFWDKHIPTRPGGCLVEALSATARGPFLSVQSSY